MNTNIVMLVGVFLTLAARSNAELLVHEWGTFTSLVGSNGVTQHGMYHEDEVLPDFVHNFGESKPVNSRLLCRRGKGCLPELFLDNNKVTLKMETPVIYFYTDKQRLVSVNVKFPEGVVTETFPAPVQTFPTSLSEPILANGNTTFHVNILPQLTGRLPVVDAGNIYQHARNVNSNLVVCGDEEEKFIFYRGLGRFQPRVSISSIGSDLKLGTLRTADKPVAAFLVHVNQEGQAQMLDVISYWDKIISASLIEELSNHNDVIKNSAILNMPQARTKLIDALINAGLFGDEAQAMINTWEHGYLKAPGLRLLYILPSQEIDEILPLSIKPTPDKLKRVFVARVEILLESQETKILNEVLTKRENFSWQELGRFAEPIMRRIEEVYKGTETHVKELLAKFIKRASLE